MPPTTSKNKTAPKARRSPNRRAFSFVDDGQQKDFLYTTFGNRVKALREKSNLTQDDLAQKAGIDRSYLAQIESGKRQLSLAIAYRITKALNVSLDETIN